MGKNGIVLQIGAGGVGGVVAHKMAKNREVFSRIILASRTISKCQAIADSIQQKGLGEIEIDSVNADSVEELVALIEKYQPFLVVNVALPYQDLSIMEACLRTKTHYLDTANYEHPDSAHFEYKEQWAYDGRFKNAGIFGLLGSGFDPGVTNVFCAYAQKHYFDEIHSIDILDCNAGDHGYAFATNFNPEINLREVSSKARYWVKEAPKIADSESSLVSQVDLAINSDLKQDTIYRKFEREEQHWREEVNAKERARLEAQGQKECGNSKILSDCEKGGAAASLGDFSGCQGGGEGSYLSGSDQADTADSAKSVKEATHYAGGEWRDIAPLALMKEWNYPEVGIKNSYLLYHEELESLIRNIKGLRQIRFFMTFGESYLTHMKVLENIGFLRIDEVAHKGGKIVPIEVLKTLLPDPASLASRTKGQTHIGCYMKGIKDGKERIIYIYNICDHESCYKEVNAQGVSYTTGVPAMIGAKLIMQGKWGVGAVKGHSALSDKSPILRSDFHSLTSGKLPQSSLENGDFSSQILECQDVADSEISESSAVEAYNAERLKLNADMPQGGEQQGIDSHNGVGVWNMEQNDPDPFMSELNAQGLPYIVAEIKSKATESSVKILEDGRK